MYSRNEILHYEEKEQMIAAGKNTDWAHTHNV